MGINKKFWKLLNAQLQGMTVGDIMETEVITIDEDATLKQLDSLITEYKHTGYPVVNNENKTIGVITHKDLLRVDKENWSKILVKDRMSTRLVCVSPIDSVIEAVEKMTEEGIGRLLVMEGDSLVGIVSRSSIMDKVTRKPKLLTQINAD